MTDHTSPDHAGVRIPPPLLFFVSIVVGLVLQRYWHMTFLPSVVARPAGIFFVLTALTIMFSGFRELRRHSTTVRPDQPSSTIVTSGPYRYSRNPLYVALTTLHLAVGSWTNSPWVILMLIPALIVLTTQVIHREEAYLARTFGEEYLSYKASVRRWL